jgi:signal transduction histidine kinase
VTAPTRLIASTPFRIVVAYLGAFILAAALIVGFVAWRANELLTANAVEALAAEVSSLNEHLQSGGPPALATVITDRIAEPGSNLYLLSDPGGRRIVGNLNAMPRDLAVGGAGHVFRYKRASDGPSARDRLAVAVARSVQGGLTLVVGRDVEDQRRFASTIGYVAFWGVGLLAALGVGAGVLISRSMLKRIDAVTETSRQIMSGDLSRRIPLDGSGDEIDRLSVSLNAMLGRIEELMLALREVSDNIAHDLKTPLTRLRSRAEAALRESSNEGHLRDALTKTMDEADELIKTFNALLLIARLEGGAVAESMKPADLAAIVGDVAELYEPVAEEAGLSLRVSKPERLVVTANRELISQAVANLVDNAITYGSRERNQGEIADPAVDIAVEPRGAAVAIIVADHGRGVAPEDRERALQRFVRLEKSRSRPGAGLGLSLVAAVARVHGGSVRLEDNAPGLRAVIEIPMDRHRIDQTPARDATSSAPAGHQRAPETV